ncbi:hypothetical protein IID24_03550 [Patescibacteria group bacterium]|nr:hypothetical protein [Patescibacteria group bacterium]
MPKSVTFLVIGIVITALVAGGGVYWWEHSARIRERAGLQQQLDELQSQAAQVISEKNTLQEQLGFVVSERDELEKRLEELTRKPDRYLTLISPNGEEQLCLGDEFLIQWESNDIVAVQLFITAGGAIGTTYPLGESSAETSETGEKGKGVFAWTVGDTEKGIKLKEGYSHTLTIRSSTAEYFVSDASDEVFSLINCTG